MNRNQMRVVTQCLCSVRNFQFELLNPSVMKRKLPLDQISSTVLSRSIMTLSINVWMKPSGTFTQQLSVFGGGGASLCLLVHGCWGLPQNTKQTHTHTHKLSFPIQTDESSPAHLEAKTSLRVTEWQKHVLKLLCGGLNHQQGEEPWTVFL